MTLLIATLLSCNPAPTSAQLDQTRGGRVDVYFNDPGTDPQNMWTADVIDIMVDLIDGSTASIEFAVMGFTYPDVIDAFERAYDRGVDIKMVGDAGHLYNDGYRRFIDRHIPLVVGNLNHIMHDKFMVVDDRIVFASTANWSNTDLRHNSNNFVIIDSPEIADDFQAEHAQMWGGKFGHSKVEQVNERTYLVGDTIVEVWFSPNEDAMGRILELVDRAEESVRFTIFAFTKDQVGSAFIRKQEEFLRKDELDGVDIDNTHFRDRRSVAGVIDQSQLHSNGQYHEVFRLLSAGIPLRMDGNDNGRQPGDYQAGGGRLHSKTMVLDAYGEHPVVITGSFNWSASATQSNDEFLIVMRGALPGEEDLGAPANAGQRIAREFDGYFDYLYDSGRRMGTSHMGDEPWLQPGAVVVNEVMWYGLNHQDLDGFDEFIELRNMTDHDIQMDLWSLSNPDDFVVGFPPGSIIPAGGLFTILDHTLEPYQDGAPQDRLSAYRAGDLVLNSFNDNRQSRLYLKDGAFELFLKDPSANVVDVAGDGGAAFAGGPDGNTVVIPNPLDPRQDLTVNMVRSMERRDRPGDGSEANSWHTCTSEFGGVNVNKPFDKYLVATPGEPNSKP